MLVMYVLMLCETFCTGCISFGNMNVPDDAFACNSLRLLMLPPLMSSSRVCLDWLQSAKHLLIHKYLLT